MSYYTKETLIGRLCKIKNLGWIETQRKGNDGGVGNTLEDLLGIEENNLPLPNAGEWEIKVQRAGTTSLTTLFHMEPSPRGMKLVPQVLLPSYGWPHSKAGSKYPEGEMSFRQTLTAGARTNRGFTFVIDRTVGRIEISFDPNCVDIDSHGEWISSVEARKGLAELQPQPYWGFEDLFHKAGTKLNKTLYVIAETKREGGSEYFSYSTFLMLEDFRWESFLDAIEQGDVLVDFDARTGHNHGTKFRLRQHRYPDLYGTVQEIVCNNDRDGESSLGSLSKIRESTKNYRLF